MSKRNFFLLLSVLTLFLIGTYMQATVYNTTVTVTGPLDASTATHTLPFKVVANTGALPSTGCTVGELAIVTSATLGQQIYQNSGSGTCTWTQQLNSGTGTVNSGTINQVAYYAATGTAISGETLLGNGNYYGVVGKSWVVTNEAVTTSGNACGSFSDAATLDTTTFTLAATTNVAVTYQAYLSNIPSGTSNYYGNIVNVDGSDVANTAIYVNSTTGGNTFGGAQYSASMNSGSHTVKIRHCSSTSGGTGNWANRLLLVYTTP